MIGRSARLTAKEVGRLMARRRWKGSLATGALLVIVSQGAAEDGELRRSLREAGLIPYWSFTPAASFSYQDVSTGRSLALAHLKGHVVLVNMWATWCPPCVREMPSLQALHAEFHERGLVVLGVNVRDGKSRSAVAEWLTQRGLTFVNLKADDDGPAFPSGFRIPQTFLIDRGGRLLANKPGDSNWAGAAVKSIVQRLLEQSAEPPQSRSDLKK
jgi:cytochrome c biogenesis protein CcmG, thiol:disulfide interchange protein DsbE